MNNIIFEIKEKFEKALQTKTGWGKNEIITLYDKIVIEVLSSKINMHN